MAGQRPKYQSELHLGIRTLAGGSRAAYGDQTKGGRRRLGCLIGVPPPPLRSPFRVAQWPSEFTRKTAEGSLGGEAYAFGEMMGHMELLREFYATFVDIAPDMVGLGGGESLFTHLPNRGIGAEKNLAGHSLDVNRSIGSRNATWPFVWERRVTGFFLADASSFYGSCDMRDIQGLEKDGRSVMPPFVFDLYF